MGVGINPPCTERLVKQFRITFYSGESDQFHDGIRLTSLSALCTLIDDFGKTIGSPDHRVAGSLFIKRYSSLLAGALYLLSHHGFAPDLSLGQVRIKLDGNGLLFITKKPIKWQSDKYLRHLFSDNVSLVIGNVAAYTKIPEATLWAHVSYLILYYFEEWIRNAESAEVRGNLQEVYNKIKKPDLSWFPGKTVSPLTDRFRAVPDPLHKGRDILIRSKCCLSYRLPGDDRYCYTCPLVSDTCRINKYIKLHGQ